MIRAFSLSKFMMCSVLALAWSKQSAAAEVKDYEVMRFLYLKTSCGRSSIVRIERTDAGLRFEADCHDKTSFPTGATVICKDPDDDRSCVLEKEGTKFHQLELLRQPHHATPAP